MWIFSLVSLVKKHHNNFSSQNFSVENNYFYINNKNLKPASPGSSAIDSILKIFCFFLLEYEVALYREASPRSDDGGAISLDLENEIPVDQAVPIGTKLQLRATINEASGMYFFETFQYTGSVHCKVSKITGISREYLSLDFVISFYPGSM